MRRPRHLLGWTTAAVIAVVAVTTALMPAGQRRAIAGDTLYGPPKIARGVRAVAYHPGGKLITSGAALRARPHSYLIRTGYGGWEPTLGVASDGTVVYAARNTNVDTRVIRSTDGGHTWRDITPEGENRHVASLDPFLWLDESTGRVFDSDIDPSITCPPISVSAVRSIEWSTARICGHVDYQKIFGGTAPKGQPEPTGYPNVVYFCAITGNEGAGSPSSTECSKTLDGGETWNATGTPAYPIKFADAPDGTTEPCDGAAPPGVVDSHGTVYIARGWCGNPYIAFSRDEGATWKRRRVSKMQMPYDGGAWPNLAPVGIDDRDNLYVAWSAKNWHIYLSRSTDGGRSWTDPIDVTPPGVTRATMPAIDGGGRGKLALTFVGTESNGNSPGKRTWNGYIAETPNALSSRPTFYAASVQQPSKPLWKGGDCGPIRCGNLGDFFTVRIGPDGSVWSALIDSRLNGSNTSFGVTDPRGEAIVGRLVGGPDLR